MLSERSSVDIHALHRQGMTISEIARRTLVEDFRNIDPSEARVLLIEGSDAVLSSYPPDLRASALTQLQDIGVEVWLQSRVQSVDASGVEIERQGDDGRIRVSAQTVIWAAGIAASPLGGHVSDQVDQAGRVKVGPDLSLPRHRE